MGDEGFDRQNTRRYDFPPNQSALAQIYSQDLEALQELGLTTPFESTELSPKFLAPVTVAEGPVHCSNKTWLQLRRPGTTPKFSFPSCLPLINASFVLLQRAL
jgi:hypothetical protein